MGVIYSITSPTGKLYVGKTYDLRKRINSHKCCTRKGSAIILHNSIRKHGWDNHLLTVLEKVEDGLLNTREMFWIATLKTYCYENVMGLNMTRGGEGQRSTWMHDIERRKKASKAFRGNKNPFFGRKVTEENKAIVGAKISKINKDKGQTVPKWGAEKSYEQSRKPIVVYDKNGDFINKYTSLAETSRQLNINRSDIFSVLTKKQVHASQMFFFYKAENYPLKIDVSNLVLKRMRSAILLLDSCKNIIKEYTSAKEAGLDLDLPHANIQRAAKNYKGKPIRTGQIFVYKDEYEINQVTNN